MHVLTIKDTYLGLSSSEEHCQSLVASSAASRL